MLKLRAMLGLYYFDVNLKAVLLLVNVVNHRSCNVSLTKINKCNMLHYNETHYLYKPY